MAFKKIAAATAASLLMVSATVAQAATASSLSINNVRASTSAEAGNDQFAEFSPLYILGGIVVVVGILEVTEAINIFGDDSPSSP